MHKKIYEGRIYGMYKQLSHVLVCMVTVLSFYMYNLFVKFLVKFDPNNMFDICLINKCS